MECLRSCLFLALIAHLYQVPREARSDESLSVTEITDRLVQQLSTVRSLHITWHKELGAEKPIGKNVWAFQGGKFLDCGTKHRLGWPGSYWMSFDGKHSHKVKYWQLDLSQIAEVERTTRPDVPNRDFGLRPLGLNLPGTKYTILTILEKHPPTLGGVDVIEGEKAYRLEFGSMTDIWRAPHVLTVWIDEFRFLPRQLELHPSHTQKPPFKIDPAKGETAQRFTIGEFRRVLDELHADERWFPVKVLNGPTALVFDEVRLNPDLPNDIFAPPTPPGTIVRTEKMVLDPVAKVMVPEAIVVGGEEGRKVLAARNAREKQESVRIGEEIARSTSVSTSPVINAAPKSHWLEGLWSGAVWWAVGLLIPTVALLWRQYNIRSQA